MWGAVVKGDMYLYNLYNVLNSSDSVGFMI